MLQTSYHKAVQLLNATINKAGEKKEPLAPEDDWENDPENQQYELLLGDDDDSPLQWKKLDAPTTGENSQPLDIEGVETSDPQVSLSPEAYDLLTSFPTWVMSKPWITRQLSPEVTSAFQLLAKDVDLDENRTTIENGLLSFAVEYLQLSKEVQLAIAKWITPFLKELKARHPNSPYYGEIIDTFELVSKRFGHVASYEEPRVEQGLLTFAEHFLSFWA